MTAKTDMIKPMLACFRKNRSITSILLSCLLAVPASGQSVDTALKNLKHRNPEVRIESLRALQTSLDVRIPEAVYPLLKDEGNSIRRLAARALGSRWWQIPPERAAIFTNALRHNAKSDYEEERNMANRAMALLAERYRGNMVSRSPNKRWVIYERRGLPCLIDTNTRTEELIGWPRGGDGELAIANNNGPVNKSVFWHRSGERVALHIQETRHHETFWVWIHRLGLRKLDAAAVVKALGSRHDFNYFFIQKARWAGNQLVCDVSYTELEDDQFQDDITGRIAWDPSTNRINAIWSAVSSP